MLRLSLAASIAALTIGATASHAQDTYGSVFGSVSQYADSPSLSGNVQTPAGNNRQSVVIDSDNGNGFGVAIGRSFGDYRGFNLRGEVELSFSNQDADNTFFSGNDAVQGGGPEANTQGSVDTTRLFLNGYADFETDSAWPPYIGAGLGVSQAEFDVSYGPGIALTDTSEQFAAQLIAGTSYDLGGGYALFGDVRYIRDFDVETRRFAPDGSTVTGTIADDIDTVAINLGVSFRF